MKLIKSIIGEHGRSLLGLNGVRNFSAAAAAVGIPAEQYDRRNYANNLAEYNTVFSSLTSQRKWFLLRDAYNDMLRDGVQPSRESFHSLIIGTMKGGARLQDAFYFRDQMKAMGLVPDVALYNFLISLCGKCGNSEPAVRILEEMKNNNVKPNGQTFICLLNTCAASGRLDQVKGIVGEMVAAGLGLNKYCFAGQITAHKNKKPITDDTSAKIIELVEQSKGWSSVESSSTSTETQMMNISEEELYNIPTADFVNKRGFIRSITVYHVAFHACADLKDKQAMETIMEMLKKDGKDPDVYITMQAVRCYMNCGDFDAGVKAFEDYVSSKPAAIELYVTLIEGAMIGHTPRGMQLATETLEKMNARNFFLNSKMGSELLLAASGDKTGGYVTANYIWDLMQARRVYVNLPAVEAYHRGLKDREIPADDPRLMLVARTLDNLWSEKNQPRGE